jgi:hypothetical protein
LLLKALSEALLFDASLPEPTRRHGDGCRGASLAGLIREEIRRYAIGFIDLEDQDIDSVVKRIQEKRGSYKKPKEGRF